MGYNINDLSSEVFFNKSIVLVRFAGEIGIKSNKTKKRMIRALMKSLRDLLVDKVSMIGLYRNRILVVPKKPDIDGAEQIAMLIAKKISGVSSVSSVIVVKTDLNVLKEKIVELSANFLKKDITFAIKTTREGKHNFTSLDVSKEVGATIISSFKNLNLKVDLTNPEFVINIDIRQNFSFIYYKSYRGLDGLPAGSQGTAVALIRPHKNSLFSAWLLKKRGVVIRPILFLTGKNTQQDYKKAVEENFSSDLQIIDITSYLKEHKNDQNLCLRCQLLCEMICSNVASRERIAKVVSPTTINFNGETMDASVLSFLESYIPDKTISFYRPLVMGFYGKIFSFDGLDTKSCCSYRSKVEIKMVKTLSDDDIKELKQKVNELLV